VFLSWYKGIEIEGMFHLSYPWYESPHDLDHYPWYESPMIYFERLLSQVQEAILVVIPMGGHLGYYPSTGGLIYYFVGRAIIPCMGGLIYYFVGRAIIPCVGRDHISYFLEGS
jgi:hypothetical protein